ncbi:hypothetical protein D3C80_1680820 [compost metagenome]
MQVAIQQDVDIQRQTLALGSVAAVVRLDVLQPQAQFAQRQASLAAHRQIEEGAAANAHRLALEDRRAVQVFDERAQGIEAGDQMTLALDIAAEAEINGGQRHPRSISTPTPLAVGTAPGLVTRMRSQRIPNSAISSAARRSAKVSTNWKCASRANSPTRADSTA